MARLVLAPRAGGDCPGCVSGAQCGVSVLSVPASTRLAILAPGSSAPWVRFSMAGKERRDLACRACPCAWGKAWGWRVEMEDGDEEERGK